MRNYKTRMTAKNIEITDDNKDSLARLLVFATTLGDVIDDTEAAKTIEIISNWNAESMKKIKSIGDLRSLHDERWAQSQDMSDITSILVDILSESDFFDIQKSLIRTLKQYSEDLKKCDLDAKPEEVKKIQFSNTDFSCQYYGLDDNGMEREVPEYEKYANLMYLSNQLAHAFREKATSGTLAVDNSQLNHVARELRKIKDWCIHGLIEQKREGSPIEIALATDRNSASINNGLISFAIPNYFEPFIVHFNSDMLSKEEAEQCDGTERYRANMKTSFPQYLSEEKMKLLQRVYSKHYAYTANMYHISGKKLEWLFATKKILDGMAKKRINNSQTKSKGQYTAGDKKTKIMDIQNKNNQTVEQLETTLGIELPKYFKDGFLKRTSYSISGFMNDISEDVKAVLVQQGVPEENLEKELAKLVIYMKMVSPISTIMRESKEAKVNKALESIGVYGRVYDFMVENLSKEEDYSALKSKTRRFANQITLEEAEAQVEVTEEETVQAEEEQNINENPEQEDNAVAEQPKALPPDLVSSFISEIASLNAEIANLTSIMQETSIQLLETQRKIFEIQARMLETLNASGTNEDKGDR